MECSYKRIKCRNNCGSEFERKYEDEHFDTCDLQMIRCPYYDMGCRTEILRRDHVEHIKDQAFQHSVYFIEGQNKKNLEIQQLKSEMARIRDDFNSKFDQLFKIINVKQKVEEEKVNPRMEEFPAPMPQRAKINNFHIYSETSEDQSIEDYQSDEFESDYSFGFRNF